MDLFEISDIIVIKGMKEGESFDPKILLIEPIGRPGLKCYLNPLLLNLIQQTKPFTDIKEIKFLPILIHGPYEKRYMIELSAIEKQDFFEERISLTAEEFLWATFKLLSASDNPDANNPPLLNKWEFATYLIDKTNITMFQLQGGYGRQRGWSCATFRLEDMTPAERGAPIINKIILPCS